MHNRLKLINPPPINDIAKIRFPHIESTQVVGDIMMHTLKVDNPQIFQLDLAFDAGKWHEHKQMMAMATASLFKEGTDEQSAFDIAKRFEDQGSVLRAQASNDHTIVSLYCLRRLAGPLIQYLFDLLTQSSFPDEEIEIYKSRGVEGLKVDLASNDVVAYRRFTSELFGSEHPYGYNRVDGHYQELERQDLIQHYAKYQESLSHVFVSGQCDTEILNCLRDQVERFVKPRIEPTNKEPFPFSSGYEKTSKTTNRNGPQTSLRMGKILKETKDIHTRSLWSVINTILGGFFGSRLMTSIREEKGYTYGIHSYIESYRHGSYVGISTEVGNEYVHDTIKEIYLQISRLKEEKMPKEELFLVKNYIKGTLLGAHNGVSKSMQSFRRMTLKGDTLEDMRYFSEFVEAVDSDDILLGSTELLDTDSFYSVLVN